MLPLIELRAPFAIATDELRDADSGARDVGLISLEAVRRIAVAENAIVFHGSERAGIVGVLQAANHTPIVLGRRARRSFSIRRKMLVST